VVAWFNRAVFVLLVYQKGLAVRLMWLPRVIGKQKPASVGDHGIYKQAGCVLENVWLL
jgi:hypothetical protein